MSQYPSPYSPPPFQGHYPVPQYDEFTPARRAGVLMMALGLLVLLMGMCASGAGQMFRTMQLPPDVVEQARQMEAQTGLTMAAVITGAGVVMLVFAVVMVVLGAFVRRGKMLPTVLSILITGIAVLLLGLMVLAGVVSSVTSGSPIALLGVAIWCVPLGLMILQLTWLIMAVRKTPDTALLQQQYAAQYWQYQQNMQSPGGYGYPPPEEGRNK